MITPLLTDKRYKLKLELIGTRTLMGVHTVNATDQPYQAVFLHT